MVKNKNNMRLWIAIIILGILFLFSSCTALIISGDDFETGNVAVIPIKGVITTEGNGASYKIVELLEDAINDDVDAVILEINSPGGSAVASDEIGQAVKKVKANNITVIAWIREMGASGGYWIASNADYIIANRMSITGSIGVIGSSFGFEEFLKEWNISYRQLTSGDKKDLGSPFREQTKEEKEFLQNKIDKIHEFFIQEVATNRGMTIEEVSGLATGEFYLGVEALENNLVDELGGLDEAVTYLEDQGINVELVKYEPELSFLESLAELKSEQDFNMKMELK